MSGVLEHVWGGLGWSGVTPLLMHFDGAASVFEVCIHALIDHLRVLPVSEALRGGVDRDARARGGAGASPPGAGNR